MVDVTLNGNSTPVEVDTGASVSSLVEAHFKSLKEKGATLHPSNAKLSTYTGETIQVHGISDVKVEHNGQTAMLPLMVIPGTGSPLLGCDWLTTLQLDWQKILQVHMQRLLQDVLDTYSEVFEDKLGMLKVSPQQFMLRVCTAVPQFHKAWSVPFALQEKVEKKLKCLQQQGIIEPIQFSDWAAPIVPVVKSNGSICICGDYKVTMNREAKLDIPRIDDLFAHLAGGQRFSKLDLSHAYQQIQLDPDSCNV